MSDSTAVASTAEQLAVAFARILRQLDIAAPLDSVLTFINSLALVGIDDRDAVYWAARATLIRQPEDIGTFDRAFAVFWEHREALDVVEEEVSKMTLMLDTDEDEGSADGTAEASDDPTITLRFSGVETLRDKDFADYSDDEMRQAQHFMESLRVAGPPRAS